MRLTNPGVEDVDISINTVTCGEYDENKPTMGTWTKVKDEKIFLSLGYP